MTEAEGARLLRMADALVRKQLRGKVSTDDIEDCAAYVALRKVQRPTAHFRKCIIEWLRRFGPYRRNGSIRETLPLFDVFMDLRWERTRQRIELEADIDKMPPGRREICLMYLDGMQQKEIAPLYGVGHARISQIIRGVDTG